MHNSNIGLIVWGCKGGHRVFCSKDVDYKSKPIADTIKDIRSFVRFNLINLTTYAVEFTELFKVFTVYRSCNDNGTGAYVAITLYVPHNVKVSNIRTKLDLAIDSYFKEFVHPVFGTYLDGKYDSIDQYSSLLESLSIQPDAKLNYKASEQDDQPHLRLYDNVSEVDDFFDSPYRKEFFCCQEVIFMSRSIYDKRPETLRFNFPETIIDSVSEPEVLPILCIEGEEVLNVSLNGKNILKTDSVPVNPSIDNISITLRKKYYKDKILDGRISQLLTDGALLQRNNKIIIGSIQFEEAEYSFTFLLNKKNVPQNFMSIREKRTTTEIPIVDSLCPLRGSKLNKIYEIIIIPCSLDTSKKLIISEFCPLTYFEQNIPISVELDKITFKVEITKTISNDFFYIELASNLNLEIPTRDINNKYVSLYAPKGCTLSNQNFDVETAETEYEYKEGILKLASKELQFAVNIPESVRSYVKNWDFTISGISRKVGGLSKFIGGNDTLKVKIHPEEQVTKGKLYINDVEYDFKERNGYLYPLILHVNLESNDPNQLFTFIYKDEVNTINDVLFPYHLNESPDISVDEQLYHKTRKECNSIVTITLERICKEPISSQPSENCYLQLNNCESFLIETNGKSITPIRSSSKNFRLKNETSHKYLYDQKHNKVCEIFREKECNTDAIKAFNKKNGFTVLYNDRGDIIVDYTKPENFIYSFIKSKKFIYSLSLSLLFTLVVIGFFVLRPTPQINLMRIYVDVSNTPEKFGAQIDNIIIPEDVQLLKSGKDKEKDKFFIDIVWNKDSSEMSSYTSVPYHLITASISNDKVSFNLADYLNDLSSKLQKIKVYDNSYNTEIETIYIETPTQKMLNEVKHLSDTIEPSALVVVFDKYTSLLSRDKNKQLENYVITKSVEILKRDDIVSLEPGPKLEVYKSFLDRFETYRENQNYKVIEKDADELQNKVRKDAEDLKKLVTLQSDFEKHKNLLMGGSCSLSVVRQVNDWWSSLSSEDKKLCKTRFGSYFETAIPAYQTFFTTYKKEEMDKLKNYKSYFSEKQYGVILKYIDTSESFLFYTTRQKNLNKNRFDI